MPSACSTERGTEPKLKGGFGEGKAACVTGSSGQGLAAGSSPARCSRLYPQVRTSLRSHHFTAEAVASRELRLPRVTQFVGAEAGVKPWLCDSSRPCPYLLPGAASRRACAFQTRAGDRHTQRGCGASPECGCGRASGWEVGRVGAGRGECLFSSASEMGLRPSLGLGTDRECRPQPSLPLS